MEKKDGTTLTLLDLSDPAGQLNGLDGAALDWGVSYLNLRFQSVQISSTRSNPIKLIVDVPQVIVLGPLLFIM